MQALVQAGFKVTLQLNLRDVDSPKNSPCFLKSFKTFVKDSWSSCGRLSRLASFFKGLPSRVSRFVGAPRKKPPI